VREGWAQGKKSLASFFRRLKKLPVDESQYRTNARLPSSRLLVAGRAGKKGGSSPLHSAHEGLSGAGGFALHEFGVGRQSGSFEEASQYGRRMVIDLADVKVCSTDAIAKLTLASGSVDDAEDNACYILSVAGGFAESSADLVKELVHSAIAVCARRIGDRHRVAKDGGLVGARLNDHGFDA
jgi:hypothetical protein